jgi:hypothetical protein
MRLVTRPGAKELDGEIHHETAFCFAQVYYGKGGLGVDLIDRRLCRICKAANILLNLRRRHIDKSQRAMVGGRIANLEDSRR